MRMNGIKSKGCLVRGKSAGMNVSLSNYCASSECINFCALRDFKAKEMARALVNTRLPLSISDYEIKTFP
jgi:hypothetical protein